MYGSEAFPQPGHGLCDRSPIGDVGHQRHHLGPAVLQFADCLQALRRGVEGAILGDPPVPLLLGRQLATTQ